MIDHSEVQRFVRFRLRVATACLAVLAPAVVGAFGMQWSAGGGVARPTEINRYVGPSPRLTGSVLVRITETSRLGVLADYTPYRVRRPETEGFQWRMLALVRWQFARGPLPEWCQPFGEFGIGVGRLEYVGVGGLEQLIGPAARLGAGLSFRVRPGIALNTSLSFDRLDAAVNGMERLYPTMLAFTVAVVFNWPRGGPLFPLPKPSASQ